MKTALKWYLIVGGVILLILVIMSFVTPAISETALFINVAFEWLWKFYTIESVILACGFIAVLDRVGATK